MIDTKSISADFPAHGYVVAESEALFSDCVTGRWCGSTSDLADETRRSLRPVPFSTIQLIPSGETAIEATTSLSLSVALDVWRTIEIQRQFAAFFRTTAKIVLGSRQAAASGNATASSIVDEESQAIVDAGEWSEVYGKLSSLSRLESGWNGYKAPAPSEDAIHFAESFLRTAQRFNQLPSRVAPSAVGGIGITFRCDARKAYVEFFNNRLSSVLFADDADEELSTKAVERDEQSYAALISEIQEYVYG